MTALRTTAPGPLRVLDANPIYFTPDGTTPVVLTGPHTWANLQDFGGDSPQFDWRAYLDEVIDAGSNCIRLWTWPGALDDAQKGLDPHPWPQDDNRIFDVRLFEAEFFERLHGRVREAGDRGVYVIVMFMQFYSSFEDGWPLLPSKRSNNVNDVDDRLINAGDGQVTGFEQDYAQEIVDRLNDLDNVIWEVGNEIPQDWTVDGQTWTEFIAWQTNFINALRSYESAQPKQHVVGVNTGYGTGGATMEQLLQTGADYIALISADVQYVPPPWTAFFNRPVLADSDHLKEPLNTSSPEARVDYVWFSFVRGYHPIDMQAIQVRLPGSQYENEPWNNLDNPSLPPSRQAMGAVQKVAAEAPLGSMKPLFADDETFALPRANQNLTPPLLGRSDEADLAREIEAADGDLYFVLADEDPTSPYYIAYSQGGTITLDLSGISGSLWWKTVSPTSGDTTSGPVSVEGGSGSQAFQPPSSGEAWVLVVSREG